MRNTGTEGAVENATRKIEQKERRQEAMKSDRGVEMRDQRRI